MDKTAAIRVSKEYADEVNKFLKPDKIIMYGSYANDTASGNSDIDIAIICDNITDKWKISTELWKKAYGISNIIEPVLLDSSDCLSGFLDEVMKTGIVVYDKDAA